ncbi:transcription termination/antitermination protein NusG [Pollutimonas bauzanensis]|uniref:Transcriptional antiterminator RfaH n=1 Tax=Pollutimonas bauzanensis TaxID=658167 RepID=A0A1M5YY58_9BURK|nr:transcription termination/antitermination NusG family protein [Pollutimonas bauzanensis]SHI16778.1 transcriptional antiterminator RfaH [Pollutimonas bauzanensis]
MPAHMAAASPACESPAAWYVAYTEPRQENLAAANLQRQGFLTYLPLYKTGKKKSSKSGAGGAAPALAGYEPMFPRYMFFKPSSHKQSISTVRSTRGVNSIVRFGPNFALVQPDILAAIQEHERQRSREAPRDISPLEPGKRIRLNDAALNGLEGLVHSVSAQRVVVLMEILGRQTRVKLPQHQVELV